MARSAPADGSHARRFRIDGRGQAELEVGHTSTLAQGISAHSCLVDVERYGGRLPDAKRSASRRWRRAISDEGVGAPSIDGFAALGVADLVLGFQRATLEQSLVSMQHFRDETRPLIGR